MLKGLTISEFYRSARMNKLSFKISILSLVGFSLFAGISEVRSMQREEEPVQARRTPRQELIDVLKECSANGKTTYGVRVDDNDSFEAFASMAQETTNFYEPEFYLGRLNNNTMTQSYWLDLVQYLYTKETSIAPDTFRRVLEHARSFTRI